MATASSKEDLTFIQLLQDKYLECALCFDTYKQPKSLVCLHTYCEPCLEDYVKHNPGDIACPTCRKVTPLPGVGVSGLENNFLIKSINEDANMFKEKTVKCNNCEDDHIAVMVCIECTSYFCTACYKMHQGVKLICESHNTLEVEKLSDVVTLQEFQKNRFSLCQDHKEPMKLYCRTENKQLCHTCSFTSAHRGHDLCSIQEELHSLTEKIGDKINQLSQHSAKVSVENDKLRNYIDQSKKSKNKSIEEIEAEKKVTIAQIENQFESMKEEMSKSADEAIVKFEEKISMNNSMITLISNQEVEKNALAMIPISESVMAATGVLGNIMAMARNLDEEDDTTLNGIKMKMFSKFPQVEHVYKIGGFQDYCYAAYSSNIDVAATGHSKRKAKRKKKTKHAQVHHQTAVPVVRSRETVRGEKPFCVGDIVMRGPNWMSDNSEDGGQGGKGKISSIETDFFGSAFEVKWDTGASHILRCGGMFYPLQRFHEP